MDPPGYVFLAPVQAADFSQSKVWIYAFCGAARFLAPHQTNMESHTGRFTGIFLLIIQGFSPITPCRGIMCEEIARL